MRPSFPNIMCYRGQNDILEKRIISKAWCLVTKVNKKSFRRAVMRQEHWNSVYKMDWILIYQYNTVLKYTV